MNLPVRTSNAGAALAAVLLSALLAACGGDKLDPVLGSPAFGVAPTVTVTTPATTPVASGVATNSTVTARFSKPMAAASITPASFTLACPAGTATAASVVYVEATQTATLTPNAVLPVNTLCTATISTAVRDSGGIPLANAYVWTFQTAPLADTTRPTVTLNTPALGAVGVSINSRVVATFSEDMNPATLTAASFTLTNTTLGAPVAGSVAYAPAGRTATFTPAAALAANSLFTATVTTAATDSAGNALAANHVWTFTTGATPDAVAPTVATISPAIASTGVCLTRSVTASFSEAMDAATITSTSFTVTDGGVAVPGSVSYDAATRLASFVPTAAAGFAASRPLVATVRSGATGVTDLAGNPLAADQIWNFTTGASACAAGVNLRSAAAFGAFGGAAGVTNQGINTVVGGNLGSTAACTLITGLHDAANVYTETPLNIGGVNGSIYCAPPAPGTTTTLAIATQARADAQTAYNELAALPPGLDPGAGQLGGLVLAAGTYTSAGGTFAITSGDLTLDAQGDSNAVFVFQSASALTVGQLATPRRVLLVGGAQARNVFWQVGSAARIEDGSTMVGTIIAPAGVTISTAGQTAQTTLIGRAIGLTASVTMVNTTVTAP